MAESTPVNPADPGLEIQTQFIRTRNVLFAKADFGPLFVDYFLHLADHGIRYSPEQDILFRHALAGMVLHCASRPWDELTAWTLHFEDLGWNLFLNGENETGSVTGRLFEEDVRHMDSSCFYADVIRGRQPRRRSVASFEGNDPLKAIEVFYRHSEQRGVKAFHLGEDVFALAAEHPDVDTSWFEGLVPGKVAEIEKCEFLVPLEKRVYRWHCGCNPYRMQQVLAPACAKDPKEVFGSDEVIEMRCPRCGARHRISWQDVEAILRSDRGIA